VAWDFSSLLECQLAIGSIIHVRRHRTHLIDLSRGFEAYREELNSSGKTMRNTLTKLKKLKRDYGEVRFASRCNDPIPAFEPKYMKYSPGSLLLYFLARNGNDLGVRLIDLGPGVESYKDYFENASNPLAAGSFELPSHITLARAISNRSQAQVRRSPILHRTLRPFVRGCRRLAGRL